MNLSLIGAGRVVGHIEVQNHFIVSEDFGIDIPPSPINLFPIGLIFKRNEEGIAQN